MTQDERLLAAKQAAKNQYHDTPGVNGFGIGDGTVRIYVRHTDVKDRLPNEVEGVPVEIVVSGDIVALGA